MCDRQNFDKMKMFILNDRNQLKVKTVFPQRCSRHFEMSATRNCHRGLGYIAFVSCMKCQRVEWIQSNGLTQTGSVCECHVITQNLEVCLRPL